MLRLRHFTNTSNVTSIFALGFGFGTSTLTMVLLIVPPLYQEKPHLFDSYGSVFVVTTVVHTAAQSTCIDLVKDNSHPDFSRLVPVSLV